MKGVRFLSWIFIISTSPLLALAIFCGMSWQLLSLGFVIGTEIFNEALVIAYNMAEDYLKELRK